MKNWNELVNLLTDRLRVDPELRLDVAEELRAHLEDSAAEFRRAGQGDEEAADSAATALGEPQQLAEELWQANRRRIRIRGLLRWSARAALVPGAILVIVAIVMGMKGGHSFYLQGGIPPRWRDDMTEEQRFIFWGDPAARGQVERAKSIADRWPDNPVYYSDYVATLMTLGGVYGSGPKIRPDRLDEMLAVLEEGEQIEPGNAFYNFTKASWLIGASSEISEDESREYETVNQRGEVRKKSCWRIEIHDSEMFQRGLAEFRRGLSKTEFTSHTVDMMELRLDVLPEPERLNDHLRRITMEVSTLLPPLGSYRTLGRHLSAHAIGLAEAGRADDAAEMVESVGLMGAKLGARSRTLIGLLVGRAVRVEGLAHAEQVHSELGQSEQAGKAKQAREEEVAFFFNTVRKGPRLDEGQMRHAGMLGAVLTPGISGYQVDFEPLRTAEQFVAAEMGLLLLLVVLVLLALLLGGLAVLSLVIQRRGSRPVLLFVGWGRIGKICLLAIVLPVAVYAFYAYVLTAGDRVYGLNYTAGKTLLEFTVALGVTCSLLLGLGYSAIRRRADEIGLAVPPPLRLRDRRWIAGVGVLIALAVVVYLVGWWAGPFKPEKGNWAGLWARAFAGSRKPFPSVHGVFLAALVVVFLLAWGVREFVGLYWRRRYDHFRRTLYRSLVPIIASAVIVVGIFCGWALARGEKSAARRITDSAALELRNELERSNFRILRDRLAEQHAAMMKKAD